MEAGIDPRLRGAVNMIRDDALRGKVMELLGDISARLVAWGPVGLPLHESPASRAYHHSYPGGLIDHILSALNIAMALCDSIEKIYCGRVNRDLVVSGVILHDIFKPLTYEMRGDGTYGFSPLGELIDHLTLASSELVKRGFPRELIHIVASSHGQASPTSPKTIEALICHIADEADSRMNGEILNAAKYLVKEATGESWDKMDSKTALKILALKAEGGWEGLRAGLEALRRAWTS